jgi:hypothetical protein
MCKARATGCHVSRVFARPWRDGLFGYVKNSVEVYDLRDVPDVLTRTGQRYWSGFIAAPKYAQLAQKVRVYVRDHRHVDYHPTLAVDAAKQIEGESSVIIRTPKPLSSSLIIRNNTRRARLSMRWPGQ